MMDKIEWISKMKEHWDTVYPLSQELYDEMAKYLTVKYLEKGSIIKEVNMVDQELRYICRGIVGLFGPDKKGIYNMIRPFYKGEIVCDFDSFATGIPNEFMIKTYTDCILITFNKRYEEELFTSNPQIAMLSVRLHYQIHVKAFFWYQLRLMKQQEAYDTLIAKYPSINDEFLFKDVASILNIPLRTFNRTKGGK